MTDTNTFSVTPNGSLLVSQLLDYERTSYYEIVVAASSGSLETNYVQVAINVQDFPDNYPLFNQREYNISLPHNHPIGVPFYSVLATTRDSFPIEYRIIGGNNFGIFTINNTNGQLMLMSSLEYRAITNYRLVIEASSIADHYLAQDVVVNLRVTISSPSIQFTRLLYNYTTSNIIGSIFGYVSVMSCTINYVPVIYSIESNVSIT